MEWSTPSKGHLNKKPLSSLPLLTALSSLPPSLPPTSGKSRVPPQNWSLPIPPSVPSQGTFERGANFYFCDMYVTMYIPRPTNMACACPVRSSPPSAFHLSEFSSSLHITGVGSKWAMFLPARRPFLPSFLRRHRRRSVFHRPFVSIGAECSNNNPAEGQRGGRGRGRGEGATVTAWRAGAGRD